MAHYNYAGATRDYLRSLGWAVDHVERRNRFIALDYLGFADLIALKGGVVVGIQVCVDGTWREHLNKLSDFRHVHTPQGERVDPPGVLEWLRQEGHAEVWSWGRVKKVRGGKAFTYQVRKVARFYIDPGHEVFPGAKVSFAGFKVAHGAYEPERYNRTLRPDVDEEGMVIEGG